MIDSPSDALKSYLLKINYFLSILSEEGGAEGSQSFTLSIFHIKTVTNKKRLAFGEFGVSPGNAAPSEMLIQPFSRLPYFPPVTQHCGQAKNSNGN